MRLGKRRKAVLARRDTLRLSLLAVLGLTSASTLAACSGVTGIADVQQPGLVSSSVQRSPGDTGAVAGVVAAMHAFGGRVYDAIAAKPGNVAISPYSIDVALAMALNGAAGKTAREMREVLGVDDPTRFNVGLSALTRDIEALAGSVTRVDGKRGRIELASANALFGDVSMTWQPAFLDLLALHYGAGMGTVDFAHASEAARKAVNAWTAKQTRDRIPEIIQPGQVDPSTRLALVNALYFKAPWNEPFDPEYTSKQPFHLASGRSVDVDMMRGDASGIGRGDGWAAVQLPYAGSEVAMTVIVPEGSGSLRAVESAIAAGGLGRILASIRPAPVALGLPRWTFRTEAPLTDVLAELGMPTAFAGAADFSGMTETERLRIGHVLHQAFVSVDEHGTEAAAATAVVMMIGAALFDEVIVDRPFVFVIHDVAHGTPLFLGRVTDPSDRNN